MGNNRNRDGKTIGPEEQNTTAEPSIRDKVIDAFVEAMEEDNAPGEVTELFKVQIDTCYAAWLAGKAVAQRMLLAGQIKADDLHDMALHFADVIAGKVMLMPRQSNSIVEARLPTSGPLLSKML